MKLIGYTKTGIPVYEGPRGGRYINGSKQPRRYISKQQILYGQQYKGGGWGFRKSKRKTQQTFTEYIHSTKGSRDRDKERAEYIKKHPNEYE